MVCIIRLNCYFTKFKNQNGLILEIAEYNLPISFSMSLLQRSALMVLFVHYSHIILNSLCVYIWARFACISDSTSSFFFSLALVELKRVRMKPRLLHWNANYFGAFFAIFSFNWNCPSWGRRFIPCNNIKIIILTVRKCVIRLIIFGDEWRHDLWTPKPISDSSYCWLSNERHFGNLLVRIYLCELLYWNHTPEKML